MQILNRTSLLFSSNSDDWRLPLGRKALRSVVTVLNTSLVTPVNLGFFFPCLGCNHWVRGIKPLLYLSRVLFVGALDRLLGGKTPALEIVGYGPQRQIGPASLLDRQPDGITGPKNKWKFELIWCFVYQKLLYLKFLLICQFATTTVTATSLSELDSQAAFPQVFLPNLAGMAFCGTDNLGDFLIEPPLFA